MYLDAHANVCLPRAIISHETNQLLGMLECSISNRMQEIPYDLGFSGGVLLESAARTWRG